VSATHRSPAGSLGACAIAARWLLLALALALPALRVAQPARPVSERSVKAAFLYQFASYVEWPDGESVGTSPVVIGVIGDDAFAQELAATTAGRKVGERPVEVAQPNGDDMPAAERLDVLFIGDGARGDLGRLIRAVGQRPVLVVTESRGAIDDGAVINFTLESGRVRFEVSLYAAELHRLKLNSRLLAVAQQVHRTPE
jgi:hypothetical protein